MRRPSLAGLLRRLQSPIAQYGALVAFASFVCWGRAVDLDLFYASYGMAPMSYVYRVCHPDRFVLDFPSGVENLAKSAPMYVYVLAYRLLGILPERVLPVYVAFELALMSVAMVALTRTLRPHAPPVVSVLVVVLVIASGARDMNFAGYAQPCFLGIYYNVADALRILGLVAMLRGRPVLSAALLGGSFISHATLGLMGGVFVLACGAARPRELLTRRHLWAGVLLAAVAGTWLVAVVRFGHAPGAEFPSKLWFELTYLNSYHWYPVDGGLLTVNHEYRFIPFLSFLILVGFYLGRAGRLAEAERKVAFGMVAMLVLTALGLAFSVLRISPTLIKLALQRANGFVLTVGLVYIVAGLWREVESGAIWRQVAAVIVLASPFLSSLGGRPLAFPGFPLLFSLVLAAPAFLPGRGGKERAVGTLLVAVPTALSLSMLAYYAATDILGPLRSSAYTGLRWLTVVFVSAYDTATGVLGPLRPSAYTGLRWLTVLGGLLVVSATLVVLRRVGRALAETAVVCALACAAVHWTLESRTSEGQRIWRRQYKDAQVWARENTAEDALFMVDPVMCHPSFGYGWRDYARRSCFGNLREWLYSGWGYDSDYEICQEGLHRLGEFGIDLDPYLRRRWPVAGFGELSAEVHRRYYAASDQWRLDLARRYHIDYFVSKKLGRLAASRLPVAYQNERFVIHRVPERSPAPPEQRR